MHPITLITPILLLLPSLTTSKSPNKSKDAVLLSQVRALTLHSTQQTSHRRVPPIPQLKCVGGTAQNLHAVDVMRCKNAGAEYDAEDIQWTCQASLPPEFKLGSTEVVCEGFEGPEDAYVLRGSCGVEYRLVLTEVGVERYGDVGRGKGYEREAGAKKKETMVDWLWRILFWVVFIAVVFIILRSLFSGQNAGNMLNNLRPGWGGGGGGGPGNGPDDPPPPYTPRAPPPPKSRSAYTAPRGTRSTNTSRRGNSGPGFWGGAATGGAAGYGAGYYMGSRNQERAREREREREREHQSSLFGSRSSWFGGGGGGAGAGPSSYGSGGAGSSSSAPAPSSSRHESTGFGGTRRR